MKKEKPVCLAQSGFLVRRKLFRTTNVIRLTKGLQLLHRIDFGHAVHREIR